MSQKPFIIVSDGACSKNPGPGGWALILVTPKDEVIEFAGQESESTNNRMELMGFYRGLQEVYKRAKEFPSSRLVRAISDSKYVLENFDTHMETWAKTGWTTKAGSEVKNKEMWEKVLKGKKMLTDLGFEFDLELVKGHAGNEANERVDQIAVKYSRNEAIDLYHGPLSDYEISFKIGQKFETVYLALINGEVRRFKTWDECKKHVEGKQGIRYKKVTNRLQEKETLRGWGF